MFQRCAVVDLWPLLTLTFSHESSDRCTPAQHLQRPLLKPCTGAFAVHLPATDLTRGAFYSLLATGSSSYRSCLCVIYSGRGIAVSTLGSVYPGDLPRPARYGGSSLDLLTSLCFHANGNLSSYLRGATEHRTVAGWRLICKTASATFQWCPLNKAGRDRRHLGAINLARAPHSCLGTLECDGVSTSACK